MRRLKRYKGMIALGMAVLCLASCGIKDERVGTGRTEGKDYEEVKEVSASFTKSMNQFAYRMLEQFGKEETENIFFSPYSIASALSMLDNAAQADTKKELETMLGIDALDFWNANMKYFTNSFTDQNAEVKSGNSVWFTKEL